eukprot:scaffold42982_cov59-Phaeocystis_antarctica.AAC.4
MPPLPLDAVVDAVDHERTKTRPRVHCGGGRSVSERIYLPAHLGLHSKGPAQPAVALSKLRLIVLHPSTADKLELPRGHQLPHERSLRRAQLSEPLGKEARLSPRKRPIGMILQRLDDPVEDATHAARVSRVGIEPAGIGVAMWHEVDVEDHWLSVAQPSRAPRACLAPSLGCK